MSSDVPPPPPWNEDSAPNQDDADREERIAEIVADYVERMAVGTAPPLSDLVAQHPEYPELADELSILSDLQSTVESERVLGTLGDYRILRQVGRGGMGIVYEAWQTSLDRRVALKVLPAGLLTDVTAVARFEREAKVAARLHHPNIVSVYGLGVESGSPYFAMEFVDGESLDRVLKRLKPSRDGNNPNAAFEEASSVFRSLATPSDSPSSTTSSSDSSSFSQALDQVGSSRLLSDDPMRAYSLKVAHAFAGTAEGLHHAHASGVIHRDIKPSNLILEPDGRLRVLDFGLARLEGQDKLTVSGEFLGTPVYMSPEQARKDDSIGHPSDVYSLGSTLYELLVWRPPFRGRDHQETLHQIGSRDPKPPRAINPRIPRDLETIVLKCLRKNPSDRYLTAEALAQDLRRFVRGQAIEARPQNWVERVLRRSWTHRGKIAAGLATLLLVVTTSLLVRARLQESYDKRQENYQDTITRSLMITHFLDPLDAQGDQAGSSLLPHSEFAELIASSGFNTNSANARRLSAASLIDDLKLAADEFPDRPDAYYQLARTHFAAGQFEEAEEALSSALRCSPKFVPALQLRSTVRARLGMKQEAESDRDSAESAATDDWSRHWLAANSARRNLEWKRAAESFGALKLAIEESETYLGSQLDARLGRGTALLGAARYNAALVEFSEAKALWPDWPEPVFLVAKTLHLKGDLEGAATQFETIYSLSESKDDAAFGAVQIYHDLGDFEKSLLWTERMQPSAASARMKADLLLHLDRPEEALVAANDAAERQPEAAMPHVFRGDALIRTNKIEDGLASYRRALQLDSSDARAHFHLGWSLLYKSHDARAAIEHLEQAVKLDPLSGSAHQALARAHELEGDFPACVKQYQAVISIARRPKPTLRHHFALALERNGQIERAMDQFQRRVDEHPNDPAGYVALGKAWERRGKPYFAMQIYHDASQMHPKHFELALQSGYRWKAHGAKGRATSAFTRASEIRPSDPRPYVLLGEIQEQESNAPQAESYYRQGLERIPDHADLHYRLAKLAEKQGRQPEVDDLLAEAVRVDIEHKPSVLMLVERLLGARKRDAAIELLERSLEARQSSTLLSRLEKICRKDPSPESKLRLEEIVASRKAILSKPHRPQSEDQLQRKELLVSRHETWRVHRGFTPPSKGLDWTQTEFDDANWETAIGPVGYGHASAFTSIGSPTAFNALYLRRRIPLDTLEGFEKIQLRVVADDGFVAYFNGKEVGRARVNSPVGLPIPHGLMATPDRASPAVTLVEIDPDRLKPENTLALIAINRSFDSKDLLAQVEVYGLLSDDNTLVRGKRELQELQDNIDAVGARKRSSILASLIADHEGDTEGTKRELRKLLELGYFQSSNRWLRLVHLVEKTESPQALADTLEQILSQLPEERTPSTRRLWNHWVTHCFEALELSAQEVRERLPRSRLFADSGENFGYRADIAWLLDELIADRPIRINCAGEKYTGVDGAQWSQDRFNLDGHRGGERWGQPSRLEVNFDDTEDDFLYQSHRWWGSPDLEKGYRLPLPKGTYRVRFHLGSTAPSSARPRLFHLDCNGKRIVERFRVSGYLSTHRHEFEVKLDKPLLEVSLVPIQWDPCISALEIHRLQP